MTTPFDSVQVHTTLPRGERLGVEIEVDGQRLVVTRRELNRIKNLPSTQQVTAQIAALRNYLQRAEGEQA